MRWTWWALIACIILFLIWSHWIILVPIGYWLLKWWWGRRHAKILGAGEYGPIRQEIREYCWRRDHGCCRWRGCHMTDYLDLHHIRHRERGGDNAVTNLIWLCPNHHRMTHDLDKRGASIFPLPQEVRQ